MNRKPLAALALALATTLAAGAAHAGHRTDLQWAVSIGNPQVGIVLVSPVVDARHIATWVDAPRVYVPRAHVPPVYRVPGRVVHRSGWQDADHDGIPNRYDHLYNPRWDPDGDGIPNRYDRRDDRREVRHDRHDRHDHHGYRHDDRHDRHDRRDGR